jgi:uncharacterized integral membrane protein
LVDASRVNIAHALVTATGFPFSGIDVLFSAVVGVVLLVTAVGARVVISRSRRPVARVARAQPSADAAPQRAAASG